ncbi:ribonuclease H [Trifolium pratense]|uniref:Ribonuclease H n=1 Tax=Trifolium pratense TaxID=57577 RepID=A0A2K3LX39_TRIPR|nr:ribonuclease H [Trifolium pratense]
MSPMYPVHHILKMTEDYTQALSSSSTVMMREERVSMIGWLPPKENFVKLNTDGANKDNMVAGCGGVIQDCQGEWIGGFAKCVGVCSAFVVEIWGGS